MMKERKRLLIGKKYYKGEINCGLKFANSKKVCKVCEIKTEYLSFKGLFAGECTER